MTATEASQLVQQGIQAMHSRDTDMAAQCFAQALQHEPGNVEALHAMASLHHAQGDIESAAGFLEQVIERDPGNAAAQNNLGILYQARGESKKARECYRSAIHAQNAFPEAWTNLGASMLMDNMHDEAEKCLGKALEIAPGYADAHFNLGKLHQARGDDQKAMAAMRETLGIQPAYAPAIAALASLQDRNGDSAAALELLNDARKAGHASPEVALTFARINGKQGNFDVSTQLATSVASANQFPAHIRAEAEFVLGDLCDRAERWTDAVSHYLRGNALKPQRFDMSAQRDRVAGLLSDFTADAIARLPGSANTSAAPVFVIGLPRSGKSCVEQLVASHPLVSGLGEFRLMRQIEHRISKAGSSDDTLFDVLSKTGVIQLDEHASRYLAEAQTLGGEAKRYLDCLPTNFLRVPLIRQLFPNARVIECRRRTDDNALYCFFKNFSGAEMGYTADLEILGEYMAGYRILMDHWRSISGLDWLDVEYEVLIDDTENTAHSLIEFLGLEWDARCLQYAEPGIARLVEPPAVSEPFDNREIGQADHYADILALPAGRAPRG